MMLWHCMDSTQPLRFRKWVSFCPWLDDSVRLIEITITMKNDAIIQNILIWSVLRYYQRVSYWDIIFATTLKKHEGDICVACSFAKIHWHFFFNSNANSSSRNNVCFILRSSRLHWKLIVLVAEILNNNIFRPWHIKVCKKPFDSIVEWICSRLVSSQELIPHHLL